MNGIEDRLAALEGRLIAHRRLLARLLQRMDTEAREDHLHWLAEREVFRDGQEDPGAVPTGVETLPLSLADEFREIGALVRGHTCDPDDVP